MEVETAGRRLLLGVPEITGYVQQKVFKYRLEERVDQTSGRAIVLTRNNGWATPDSIKTSEYPILSVKCYADPDRGPDGEIVRMNAEDKAFALYRAVNTVLHGKRETWWGAFGSDRGLMVVSSARWKEPNVIGEKDRHGETAGDPLGDAVYVYAEYALHVVHG